MILLDRHCGGVERKYVSSSSCNKGRCATMHVNVHDSEDTLLVNHDEQNMRGLGLIIQDIPKRGNLIGVEKFEGCYPERESQEVQRWFS